LPILLSAVLVLVASGVIHLVLHQWHSQDFKRFAAERTTSWLRCSRSMVGGARSSIDRTSPIVP
jgi:hypothetical protein